jgi:hypothetical protein
LTKSSSLILGKQFTVSFENRKPFSDFEHLIFKSTDPTKIHLGPCRELTETHLGLDRDPPGTCPKLDRNSPRTQLEPYWDLPRTRLDLNGTCLDLHRTHRDLTRTCLDPVGTYSGTCLELDQDPLTCSDLPKTSQDLT